MEVDSKPEAIDEFGRGIIRLKIEREALRKKTDKASRDRLEKFEVDFAELEKKEADLNAIWQLEKGKIEGAHKIKEELDQARVNSNPSGARVTSRGPASLCTALFPGWRRA